VRLFPLAAAFPAYRHLLLAITSLDVLHVDRMPISLKHHMQATIAQPPPLLRTSVQPLPQDAIVWSQRLTVQARSINAQHSASPAFAYLLGQLQVRRRSIYAGRHNFSPSRFFSATLSRIESASIRFSLAFSSPSALQTAGLRHIYPAILGPPA
jgi:hypothetical protein